MTNAWSWGAFNAQSFFAGVVWDQRLPCCGTKNDREMISPTSITALRRWDTPVLLRRPVVFGLLRARDDSSVVDIWISTACLQLEQSHRPINSAIMSLILSSLQTRLVRPLVTNVIFKRTYVTNVTRPSCQLGWKTGSHRLKPNNNTKKFASAVAAPSSPVAAAAATTTTTTTTANSSSNIFLDNLGTVFLGGILTVIVWLVRSYMNGQTRNQLRDQIEATAHADPIEMDDLRTANTPEFNIELFLEIHAHVLASSSSALQQQEQLESQPPQQLELRYDEFVGLVREVMARKLGTAAFTVQLGYILDRVAASALERRGKSLVAGDDTMPILFWFTLLSLALSSPPKDRIDALYAVLSSENNNGHETTTPAGGGGGVTLSAVTELVGYLQDTCQLVPDAQVMATTHQYPLQQYDIASPVQLVDRYRVQSHSNNKNKEPTTTEEDLDRMDNEQLWDMLTSNSICVWGECYKKKKRRQG
jgi:hypothetical protein